MPLRRLVPIVTAALVAAGALSSAPPAFASTQQQVQVTPLAVFLVTGTPQTFTFTGVGPGDPPVGFRYTFGTAPAVDVPAVAGAASVTVTPTARVEPLDIQPVAPDGSLGLHTFAYYFATAGTPAADKDLNGDGRPDLLTTGGTPALTDGLWQALGTAATGRLAVPATNVLDGASEGDPAFFNDAELVTGDFSGSGFQDVLAYFGSGPRAGVGILVHGQGDGSHLYDFDSNGLPAGTLTDAQGRDPLELANSYDHASGLDGLIGRTATGLDVYPPPVIPGGFYSSLQVDIAAPDGTTDWSSWRIATAKAASGASMFLWKPSTGALYLWRNLTFSDNGDGTATPAFTPYLIARRWQVGKSVRTFEAADFSGNGIPDIWTVDDAGTARAFVIRDLHRHGPAEVVRHSGQSLG